MDSRIRQRITGTIALAAIAVILLPFLLDGSAEERHRIMQPLPPAPRVDLERLSVSGVEQRMAEQVAASEAQMPVSREVHTGAPDVGDADTPALEPTTATTTAPAQINPDETERTQPSDTPPAFTLDADGLPRGWSLQVASFGNEGNATALRTRLRASGYLAYIRRVDGDGGPMYRVFVGPMLDRDKLESVAIRIEADLDLAGRIVPYDIAADRRLLGG